MKKLAFLGGAAAIGIVALGRAPISHAADHLDSPATLGTNPMADLNDVYAWMTSDSGTVNLAMTVSPLDDGTRSFGPSVVYAFHVSSHPAFNMAGVESKIICKFASNTDAECWLTDPAGKTVDYVKGDFSAASGKASVSGKLRVFAGQRSDPFFFNLGGFKRGVGTAITNVCGGTTCPNPNGSGVDASGCLQINKAGGDLVRSQVSAAPPVAIAPCAANQVDCFANFNVMAIVIQVDKAELLNGADKLVSVWASTHTGS